MTVLPRPILEKEEVMYKRKSKIEMIESELCEGSNLLFTKDTTNWQASVISGGIVLVNVGSKVVNVAGKGSCKVAVIVTTITIKELHLGPQLSRHTQLGRIALLV